MFMCNGSLFGLPLSLLMGFVCVLFIFVFVCVCVCSHLLANNHLEKYVCMNVCTNCLYVKSMQICVESVCVCV